MPILLLLGITLTLPGARIAFAADIPLPERLSGYQQMSPSTRDMQDDDMANPGMLWVLDGESLWRRKAGPASRACADCHGDATTSMKGVAARYPVVEALSRRPINLEQRINACRTTHQQAPAFADESRDLLAITSFVSRQSRGMPIDIEASPINQAFINAGREEYQRRRGQLNIACSQCHDDNWGKRLAGNLIPQAHPTGYPIYRLEWQGLGSLPRRLRACMGAVRAEPYDYGSPELVNLELFLKWRARGMTVEAPGVRP